MELTEPTCIHSVPEIDEEASGPSYSVLRLCSALRASGIPSTVIALSNGLPADALGAALFPRGHGPKRLGSSPAMLAWLRSAASEGRLTLLHNHSLWMMPNVYPGWVCSREGVPLVVSPRGTLSGWAMSHGSIVKKLFWPFVQRPALAATRCFHATALSEYEDIRRVGFTQPVAVIPNGIDIPDIVSVRQGPIRTLLFLGRIHPKKGLPVLLRSWQAISKRFSDWRLRIVGPDNNGHLAEIQSLAAALQLQRISFEGPLYGSHKTAAYRDSDLFVLPTHSENFGVSVAEAMAAGTPVIVTRGAPWQGIEAHGAGWWPEISVEALTDALSRAMSLSPAERQDMGVRGRNWMRQEYSWTRVGSMMSETYRWIRGASPMPPWVRLD